MNYCYTSSWGTTLLDSDNDLEYYRQLSKTLKSITSYQQAVKNLCNLNGFYTDPPESISAGDLLDYTDVFLDAYANNAYTALINQNLKEKYNIDDEYLTDLIGGTLALSFVSVGNKHALESSEFLGDTFYEEFCADLNVILSASNTALELPDAAFEYSIMLDTLLDQKDSTVQVMNRIKNNTSDNKIKQVMTTYSNYVEAEGNDLLLNYSGIISNVTDVGSSSIKTASKLAKNFVTSRENYKKLMESDVLGIIPEGLSEAAMCFKIALWVADKATNIKDASKKIYLCHRINNLIDEAVNVNTNSFRFQIARKSIIKISLF